MPIGGGVSIQLNGPLVDGGGVGKLDRDFVISADSTMVAYVADQDIVNLSELYSVPIGGGIPQKLNNPLNVPTDGGFADYFGFQISTIGSNIVYVADQETNDVYELYSVPIGGGVNVKLNSALVSGGNVDFYEFKISSDGKYVVYRADQEFDEVWELYSVPITGGIPIKLNGALVNGGNVNYNYHISPNGNSVVYCADQDTDEVWELYSVPITGGDSAKLNGTLAGGGDVDYSNFQICPDNITVVYQADQETDEVQELYRVPITGGVPSRLSGPLVSGGSVKGFHISADGSTVVYLAEQDTDGVTEIFRVSIGGGVPVKMNAPLVGGGNVSENLVSSNGNTVVYVADQDTDGVLELYASTLVCSMSGAPDHSSDFNQDNVIVLSELLRGIQFFNLGSISCQSGSEDGYAPGNTGDFTCAPHSSDYNPQDWMIDLPEMLRLIQLYNSGYYYACPGEGEDGFCPCAA